MANDAESRTAPKARRRFDQAFKSSAVQRVVNGEALKAVALDLGVNPTLLSRWKSEISGPVRGRTAAPRSARRDKSGPARGKDDSAIRKALRSELASLEKEARVLERKIAQIKATLALY